MNDYDELANEYADVLIERDRYREALELIAADVFGENYGSSTAAAVLEQNAESLPEGRLSASRSG